MRTDQVPAFTLAVIFANALLLLPPFFSRVSIFIGGSQDGSSAHPSLVAPARSG